MANAAKIKEALGKLDPKNDSHWTAEGTPRLETIRLIAGDSAITRDDINKENQSFNRQAAIDAAGAPSSATSAPKSPTVADVAAASAATAPSGDNKVAGETAVALPLKADGTMNPNLPVTLGMVGGTPLHANAEEPGKMKAPDGKTLNPTADSDNQPGNVLGDSGLDESGNPKPAFDEDEEDDELEGQIKAKEQELEDLGKKMEDARKYVRERQTELDLLYAQRTISGKPEHLKNMENIQKFLGGEQRRREQRGGVVRESKGEKAPIDKAMENRPRPKANLNRDSVT